MRKPILTIFYQFNPWNSSIGGIQTVIRSFIKYAPTEFEVRLVGTGEPKSSTGVWQKTEYAGRSIQFMPLFNMLNDNVRGFIPTTVKYTAALLGRCLASDFIHFHRLEPTVAALNWSGDKTLFIHNDIQQQIAAGTSKKAMLWQYFPAGYFALERFLIKQFDQIYSCNTQSAQFYQERYPEIAERVTFLKNTVDTEIFYPLEPREKEKQRKVLAQQLGLPEQTRFVLFAGRLHPQKDPILLVRAYAALNDPSLHLLIAGDGELAGEVRSEIARLALCERVTMLGSVSFEKLAQLHRISSAFVLSSAYEGLPMVVLEALSSGTPVVTTNCGETPRLLRADSGMVAYERTPFAIANALGHVLQHAEDYPAVSCVRNAQPYAAHTVVSDVYTDMLHRWKHGSVSSTTSPECI
ncbi:glycosyltransferase family 4 protein [Moorena sp. SIO4G3]|uniref:glycosyltransferase family 4 protein n=1 Tax=Moorena sp. SIO4G3 TaxID=2607821 RepID=UPI00142B0019|nr:glycosyltransferase family 4 protein [Moorena sp. SIO4G3]NEO76539.1 glycosyltransferase family 4 protein [Moorena sp. SIO4G3]